MGYQPEKWQPKEKIVDVFLISLENIEDIKSLLGATSVRQAYNRNRTILIEWTMMHRETFSGLVGQYIVRNDRGQFEVLDPSELREDYVPHVEEVTNAEAVFTHESGIHIDGLLKKLGLVRAVELLDQEQTPPSET